MAAGISTVFRAAGHDVIRYVFFAAFSSYDAKTQVKIDGWIGV
jgi:hypothetical protein